MVQTGLPYSKKLSAHTSCVNSLAFSKEGRWLASAGDDPYIHLWDFNQKAFTGPRSNVFTVAFSASGQYLYSGDTQDIIYQYDLLHMSSPVAHGPRTPSWRDTRHEDSIRAISCHPETDNLFLSGAEDGKVILHDMRTQLKYSHAQSLLQHTAEITCVQYHPTMTHIFATSDNRGQVCLRDVRMAFGPLSQRSNAGIVHEYVTTIAKQGTARMARPEASSLTFDRDGTFLLFACIRYLTSDPGRRLGHHIPTLYSLNDPYPIATFSDRFNANRIPGSSWKDMYSNSCTMKHGTFGGLGSDRDMFYAQGSDDFRTYIWKIPDDAELLAQRAILDDSEWHNCPRPGEIGYASSLAGSRYVPFEVSRPFTRLGGHGSIVNTALFHPHRPLLLTAGIERFTRLHSPTPTTPCTERLEATPLEVRLAASSNPGSREVLLRAMGMVDDSDTEEAEDDSQAIAMFDHILRQEGNGDVFSINPWTPGSDDETDSDSIDDHEGVSLQ
ncbi:WD40 repeat-like protein [Epithele typhae]|uniref:WD40 repeat-like protein n=1 Tax=Epithele typhae TaxID=378194 RepID=UPI0020074AED|nr:WD40 repeat-like protein [Epithele typhae]KAH9931682.1 WD40 repeat-like protein [Epithele typhae]